MHPKANKRMKKERITLGDKTFETLIPESEILNKVEKLVQQLKADYADKNPVFVVVLNGAFAFASDIFRFVDFPCQVSFTKFSSYDGTQSSGRITEQLAVTESITDRHVIIVEDIVETGYSMEYLVKRLQEYNPASLQICCLSYKPEKCLIEGLPIKYIGMTLPDAFVVGHGFDYNQQGRLLKDLYALVNE